MAADEATDMSATEASVPEAAPARAEAKASPKAKRAVRPKIDLDDEIRRANDLAAMSRKMLTAAKNISRNHRKAKQRPIKNKLGSFHPKILRG